MIFYFKNPTGGYLLFPNAQKKPVLHTGLTALQISGLDSTKWSVGLALLIIEAALAFYLIIRFCLQKHAILYHGKTDKNYIFSLQVGRRRSQNFSYIIVLFCLLSSVIDRTYTHTVSSTKHQFAIIDWINISNRIFFNLTDAILLLLGSFIIINIIYCSTEKGLKWIIRRGKKDNNF